MPSSAITRALNRYQVGAENLSPEDAYVLSKYFGVSYRALAFHIYGNLHLIPFKRYQNLKKAALTNIRFALCGFETKNQVFKIGNWWDEKSIEMEVGDIIVSETELSVDGPQILEQKNSGNKFIYEATSPGTTRIYNNDGWSCFTKVSRYKFQGLYQFKYEEEDDEE